MLQRRSTRWIEARGLTAVRALAVLTAAGCCLGAAAYAATRGGPVDQQGSVSRPLKPRLIEHPDPVTTVVTAEFDFVQPSRPPARANPGNPLRFRCRLDRAEWSWCRPPARLRGLGPGRHRFEVRAVNAGGRSGPAATYGWRLH
nr:hypothetical protein [Solirubrobacterales bacterium]